jgi:hypothetical protein
MRRVLAVLVVALATGAVAGCGGSQAASSGSGSSSAASGGSSAATGTQVAATTTASGGSASGPSAASSSSVTAPGAALAAGQTATVPFQITESNGSNGPTYKLRITVQSIQRGTLADFNGIQLDSSQKDSIPYYARVRMTNVGPNALSTSDNDPAGEVQGLDHTGQPQDSVTFLLGTFPRCPDTDTPNPFKAGQSFDTCLTFLVPGGITKVAYTGPPQSYYDSPVTWAAK